MFRSSRSDNWKSAFWPRKSATGTSPTSLRHQADVIGHGLWWRLIYQPSSIVKIDPRKLLFLTFFYSPARLQQTTGAPSVTIYWCVVGSGDMLAVTATE